jgi:hypothetical protein
MPLSIGQLDNVPPVITAISPTPSTTPGAAGGFSATYATARATPIVISAIDLAPGLGFLQVVVVYLDGTAEIAYRAGAFTPAYAVGSASSNIAYGLQLSILRNQFWPGGTLASNLAVSLIVDAVDGDGNIASSTFYYELPVTQVAPPAPSPPVAAAIGAADVIDAALGRLVWQLRS